MRRIASVFLSLAVLAGLTAALDAQSVDAANDNTSIEIDGDVKTTFFHRDGNISEILEGGPAMDPDPQNDVLYEYNLGLTADVGDHVSGRLELEQVPLDGSAGAGLNANDNAIIGNNTDIGEDIAIGEASIKADHFLFDALSLKVGIQDYDTDLRGDGNAFLIDLHGSEGITDGLTTVQERSLTGAADPTRDLNNTAGGALATLGLGENHDLDLFWFTARDDTSISKEDDERLLGGRLHGSLQDRGSYQFIVNAFEYSTGGSTPGLGSTTPGVGAATHSQRVWNVGGGAEYDVTPNGNLYGELYFQGGEVDNNSDQDTAIAGYIGYEHRLESVWFDVSYTHVTGDDGQDRFDGPGGESAKDNEDFISYEDNDATMILEDNVLGLDVQSNYYKLQGEIGTSLTTGLGASENDLDVSLLVAWAQVASNVESHTSLGGDGDDLVDDLGVETDLVLTWHQNESMFWELGIARVWGADFFEDTEGALGYDAGDGLDLWTFSGNLTF